MIDADDLKRAWRDLTRTVMIAKARCYRAALRPEPDAAHVVEAARVLADLRRFCRADATIFSSDPYQAARLAGRREVWLRIVQYLALDERDVRALVEVESDYAGGE